MSETRAEPGAHPSRRGRSAFRQALDVLLLAGVGLFGYRALAAAIDSANVKAEVRAAALESHALYRAFEEFHQRNLEYPADYRGARFEVATLEPLRRRGYYRGAIGSRLLDGTVDAFGSPDDRGVNQEFWVEMTLARAPELRILVAKSDDAPMSGGEWRDGVFLFRRGALEPL